LLSRARNAPSSWIVLISAREHDRGVLVNRDLDERLQVAQLQRERWAIITSTLGELPGGERLALAR